MTNPYIIDRPLGAQDLFFGRERVLAHYSQAIPSGQRLFLLYGQRRIGKTSLLNQLPAYLGEDYRVLRIDWEEHPEREQPFLMRVWLAVAEALNWDPPAFAPDTDPGTYHAYLAENLGRETPPSTVLCLDGLPQSLGAPESGWAEAVASLAEQLQDGPLILLLAIEARPEECEPTDVDPDAVTLSGLDLEQTEDLLLMSTRGQMTYDLDSMRRIYALTGGEPFLVQLFGHTLFELRARQGWVSLPEVDGIVETVTKQAAPQFSQIWSRSSLPARIVLCVFAEGQGSHAMASADDIQRRLLRLRVDVPQDHIKEALADLKRQDVVERLGGGLYRFRSSLFLLWLRANKNTLETIRRSREYRRAPRPTTPPLLSQRIDWLGLGLWVLIAALVLAIGSVWRSREVRIVWTDQPPTAEPQMEEADTGPQIIPVPERTLPSGRIAFMGKQEEGHFWDIYTMTADGLDPVRLTDTEADDTLPAWSPDGRRLAFVSDRDGNREIYLMNTDGSDPVNLTQNPAEDWTPNWSPDGTQIAFASFRDGNWEIYIMDADGSNQHRVTRSNSANYSPAWSPDGEWIAFVSNRTGNLEIFVMRPDGTDLRQFTNDPATDQTPTWSHDGRQLLWESYRFGNMEIMVADFEGGEPRNLSQDTYADDHGPSMCPSGQRIAYFSNRDRGWDIFTLDLQTGERTNLTQSIMIEQYPVWAP